MNFVRFRKKRTSRHQPLWHHGSTFRMVLLYCLIMVSFVFLVSPTKADARLIDSGEKSNVTHLAIFLMNSNLTEEAGSSLAEGVLDLLTIELMHKPDVELIERTMIDKIMDEYALTLDQSVKPEKAIRLGKMAGADVTIVGKLVRKYRQKSLLVKVIDNTSGIIKGIAYFQIENELEKTISAIAEFVWTASVSKMTIDQIKFIAVGGFADQSIYDMQINGGDKIRRFLEHKYSSEPGICVMARSQMKPLLLEMGLNDMGFTASGNDTNLARPAFTIVDGNYHVVRKAQTIIIVNLRIEFLGRSIKNIRVEGASWNYVLRDIGEKIDSILKSVESQ